MKKATKCVVVNTKQDLSKLNDLKLRKLRVTADEMGLREFRDRIDGEIGNRRAISGKLTERELIYRDLGGTLPPKGLPKDERVFWLPVGGLAVEIEEGELRPATPAEREFGIAWVWERGERESERERQAIKSDSARDAWQNLRDCLKVAQEIKAAIVPILFAKGSPRRNFRRSPLVGQVERISEARGGFKINFRNKESSQ
jgi:hypothetical protein